MTTAYDMWADDVQSVDTSALADITALARKAKALEKKLEAAKQVVKDLESQLAQVTEDALPTAFAAAGVESFTTSDGLKITVRESIYMSIPQANKAQCAAWLIDHGQDHLISCNVIVSYNKGEREAADDLAQRLAGTGLRPRIVEDMNTQSVKALIRELREAGVDVPLKLFGGYVKKAAEIKGSD